jgi:hypothetical protein
MSVGTVAPEIPLRNTKENLPGVRVGSAMSGGGADVPSLPHPAKTQQVINVILTIVKKLFSIAEGTHDVAMKFFIIVFLTLCVNKLIDFSISYDFLTFIPSSKYDIISSKSSFSFQSNFQQSSGKNTRHWADCRDSK